MRTQAGRRCGLAVQDYHLLEVLPTWKSFLHADISVGRRSLKASPTPVAVGVSPAFWGRATLWAACLAALFLSFVGMQSAHAVDDFGYLSSAAPLAGYQWTYAVTSAEKAIVQSYSGWTCSGWKLTNDTPASDTCLPQTWTDFPYSWGSCDIPMWNYDASCTNGAGAGGAIFERKCDFGFVFDNSIHQCVAVLPVERQPALCLRGDPCDASTGNEHHGEVDYRGTGPLPLKLVRTYNSLTAGNGAFGDGWSSSFGSGAPTNAGLVIYEVIDPATTPLQRVPSYAEVTQPDGSVAYFWYEGPGLWTTYPDSQDTFNGTQLTEPNGTVETFAITSDDPVPPGADETGNMEEFGAMVSATGPNGLSDTYTYDPTTHLLTKVSDPFGHSLAFTYDSQGRITSMTDPNGDVYTYTYDANDNLSSVTYPDGTKKTYLYDETDYNGVNLDPGGLPHLLTGIIDQNGNRYVTIAYNAAGQAIETTHPQTTNSVGQQQTTFSYDSSTQTTVTNAAGIKDVLTFQQDSYGLRNLISRYRYNSNGTRVGTLIQTVDSNNNVTCRQDEDGHVTLYSYDSTNQMVAKTEGDTGACSNPQTTSATRTISYHYLSPTLDLLTEIDRPSVDSGQTFSTVISYGDSTHPMLPTAITENGFTPSGTAVTRTIGISYTPSGQIATLTDPLGHVTTFAYNSCASGGGCGELASVTNALGQAVQYNAYYADGLPQTRTNLNGTSDQYAYDALRRLTADTTVASAIRHVDYAYWPSGQIGSTYFSTGLTVTNSYDAAQELTSTTYSLGGARTYYYGPRGNQTVSYISNPGTPMAYAIEEQSKSYDVWNHLSLFSNTDGTTTYVNDALGNVLQIISPNEQGQTNPASTQNTFDALNRLVETVDRAGGITTYDYDTQSHLTGVATPNGTTTSYVVDDLGDVLSETSPDRGTTTYTYDAAGNLTSKTDARGIVTDYTYDALNRLTSITYPSDSTENVTDTYDSAPGCSDGIGHLCAETDESGTSTYSYDGFGHLVSDTRSEPGGPYTTTYTPDPFGAIDSETYPDGRVVTYTRDAAERITAVTATVNGAAQTILSHRVWRADNRISSQTWGNGLSETRGYDYAGRLLDQSIGSDTRIYDYDPDGNLTSLQTIPQIECFGYDVLDRLTQSTVETQSGASCPPATPGITYTYDGNGNRLSKATGTTTIPYTYTPDSNRLATVGGSAVTINKFGAIIADPEGRSFAYDNAGRLIQATSAYGVLGLYSYDSHNRRANKFSANGSTWYHYDAQGHLIEETHQDGTLVRDYIWADSTPIAMITKDPTTGTETVTYLHTDYDDTPRMATNQSGTILWRWEGVFGDTLPSPNGVDVTLRYPGQTYDSETGLFYNWSRYYDPSTGRYVSSDPIGLAGGLNTYAYALNNPIYYIDPAGLLTLCEMNYLNDHFTTFGGFIADTFNLQQIYPFSKEFSWSSVKTAIEVGGAKVGVIKGTEVAGKAFFDFGNDVLSQGAVVSGAALTTVSSTASGVLEVLGAAFTPFATMAVHEAQANCRCDNGH